MRYASYALWFLFVGLAGAVPSVALLISRDGLFYVLVYFHITGSQVLC